ncbi:GNAT family N-acetyltransferase [Massilia sp. TWR1-2-2]|uniref:GNAT family N-acetyltransferase n=1 Tax=Massilia sp. TWR1-2-2 TaxID=2804584 RepID=UPI003CF13616
MQLDALAALLAPLQIRAPDPADADFLARLYASTRTDLQSATADPTLVASIIGMQQRLQAADYRQAFPNAHYLLLEQSGSPCGRIVIDAGAAALRLVDMALLPAARGHGLGSHILRALQACAQNMAMPLTLSVHHSNPRARRLYVALGFQVTARNTASEQLMWCNTSL